jgi:hypothetical protein
MKTLHSRIRNGYVAFFDILGYREMTSRDDFEEIIQALEGANTEAKELLHRKQIENAHLFSFGDSMIVFCPGDTDDETYAAGRLLSVFARSLFSHMFARGMPVRGAIAKGDFYYKDNSYAGKPLNEAYEYANCLEFAGCVLTPSAEDLKEAEFQSVLERHKLFTEVSVPLKNYGKQRMYVLRQRVRPDRERVRQAFQRHGKSITPSVLPKLNNTVEVLRKVHVPPRKVKLKKATTHPRDRHR